MTIIQPPPSGYRSLSTRRSRSQVGSQPDPDVTGFLPRTLLWLPITLAMLLAGLILAWLLFQAGTPPAVQSSRSDQAASVERSLSPVFSPEIQRWSSDILRWSATHGLDPNLVATVMQIESCGHPSVRSSAGAIGLFQVMPYHFSPEENPLDPETNARRGLAYLARAFELSDGQMDLTLAGYNGGLGVIQRDASLWSAETQRYVAWGSSILADIATGSTQSSSLQSWLQTGGDSLCRRASLAQASLLSSSTP